MAANIYRSADTMQQSIERYLANERRRKNSNNNKQIDKNKTET